MVCIILAGGERGFTVFQPTCNCANGPGRSQTNAVVTDTPSFLVYRDGNDLTVGPRRSCV